MDIYTAQELAYKRGYEKGYEDALNIVRCKDCVNWHNDTLSCDYMPYGESQEHVNWYDTDFCSYGERKDNGR